MESWEGLFPATGRIPRRGMEPNIRHCAPANSAPPKRHDCAACGATSASPVGLLKAPLSPFERAGATVKGGTAGLADDVQTLVRDADEAFARHDWEYALETYQKVMQLDAQNDEACEKIARIYSFRGLIQDVIKQYFLLIAILEGRGEYDLALEIARWVMQIQPENDKARQAQINIHRKRGQNDEVVRQSLQLARLYIELGLGDQSIDLLKNAQEVDPENLDIGTELAEIYVSHGHIQEGVAQFRQIANLFVQKQQYDKAADAFKRMKVIQSDDPSLLFTLGELYVKLNRLNDAEAEFRAILRHDLNHVEALLALGNVCHQKGQFRDAILAFNKITMIDPDAYVAKEKLGELYHAQGNVNEAIKHYLSAAAAYQQFEEQPQAIKLFQRVVSLDPTNPTACRELTNLGAPLEPENPADLGPGYQPQSGAAAGPGAGVNPDDPSTPEAQADGKPRSKFDGGGSSLVPREGGAGGGGKSMLPRPGLMSPRSGGGGLVAKGDGAMPVSSKRRLGEAAGGDKPTLGGRSKATDPVGDARPELKRGRAAAEQEPEYESLMESVAEPVAEPVVEAPAHPVEAPPSLEPDVSQGAPDWRDEAPLSEAPSEPAASLFEDPGINEPLPVPEEVAFDASPTPEPAYDDSDPTPQIEPVIEEAPSAPWPEEDIASQQAAPHEQFEVDHATEQVSPSFEAVVEPEPPAVEPLPSMEEASPAEHAQSATEASEPSTGVSSRAPLQPRLLGRGATRGPAPKSGGRPLLGGGRGKSEGGKPTLPVRGARADANDPVEPEQEVHVSASEEGPPPDLAPTDSTESTVSAPPTEGVAASSDAEVRALSGETAESAGEQPAQASSFPTEVGTLAEVLFPALLQTAPASQPFDGSRALEALIAQLPPVRPRDASEGGAEVARLDEYLAAGDVARALDALRLAAEADPSSHETTSRLAAGLFAYGVVDEATAAFTRLAQIEGGQGSALYYLLETILWSASPQPGGELLVALASAQRQLGDTDRAQRLLLDALALDRENVAARLALIDLHRVLKQDELASWHMRTLNRIADEATEPATAAALWRAIFHATGSAADHERMAVALDKAGLLEEAVVEYRVLASQARDSQDVPRARALYERVVELSPADTEAQENLLHIYQSTGDESAVVDKMRQLAEAARQNGDRDAALRLCEEIVRRDASSVEDRQRLVELYLDKGLLNNARSEAQGLVEVWYRENRCDEAISLLRRIVDGCPEEIVLREPLVHFLEKTGQARAAVDECLALARLQVGMGAFDDALKVLKKALALDERNVDVLFDIGALHADHLDDASTGEQHLLRVLQADPRHKRAAERLISLQLLLGKPQEAIPRLAELVSMEPSLDSIREALLTEYKARCEASPEDMQSKFTLGLLYRISGQIEDAIVLFQDTRKAHELFLLSCNMLGQCFWERRVAGPASAATEEAAVKWFKRGLEATGYPEDDYLELRYNLAEVYNHRNEVSEALKLYRDIYHVNLNYRDVAEKMNQLEDEIKGAGKVARLRTS